MPDPFTPVYHGPDFSPLFETKVRETWRRREHLLLQAYIKCLELGEDYVVVCHGPERPHFQFYATPEYAFPHEPVKEVEIERITICRESDIGEDHWPCQVIYPNQASAHQKFKFMAMVRARLERKTNDKA